MDISFETMNERWSTMNKNMLTQNTIDPQRI